MSYQQPPRRPRSGQGRPSGGGYGPEPGYGRPGPSRKPAYHQTRMLPLPGQEQPRDYGPPPRRPAPPDDFRRPPAEEGYPPPPPRRPRRKPRWGRRILIGFMVLLLLIVGSMVWMDFSLNRVAAIPEDYPGRPAAGAGTNWLIVGSDSREGLTEEEKAKLTTGDTAGKRTDTIMVAHVPDNNTPATLLSMPRDLRVEVPGHGRNQINAAFSLGGPQLLVKTIEGMTGLRIDHYAEISFGGFANIVDAVGGVEMDIPAEMRDTKTGAVIPAGRQRLDGVQALAFVRMRYSSATPRSDLDRVVNQRKFIGALAGEIASAGTLLNPFTLFPVVGGITDALTVDEGDHLWHLASLGFAMSGISDGSTVTLTVPVTDASAKNLAEDKAGQLFDSLRNDTAIPADVITP